MKDIICIICPRGCKLSVDPGNGYAVSGAFCKRGEAYGRAEAENPVRILTSSVPVGGALYPRCPVKSAAPIPKRLLFAAMDELRKVRLTAPVKAGQVVAADICGTGIPVVATRTMPQCEPPRRKAELRAVTGQGLTGPAGADAVPAEGGITWESTL